MTTSLYTILHKSELRKTKENEEETSHGTTLLSIQTLKLTLVESFCTSSTNAFQKTILSTRFFNRYTLKLSYSCLPNMKSIISSHNKHVLSNSTTQQPDTCNCRKKPDSPLEGKCLQTNVIYQATVTTETTTETYVGLATKFLRLSVVP